MKVFVNSDLSEFKVAKMICYNVLVEEPEFHKVVSDRMEFWGVREEWVKKHVQSVSKEWMIVSEEMRNVFALAKYMFNEEDYRMCKVKWTNMVAWNDMVCSGKWEDKLNEAMQDHLEIVGVIDETVELIKKGLATCDEADELIADISGRMLIMGNMDKAADVMVLVAKNDAKRKSYENLKKATLDYCHGLEGCF